GGGGVSGADDVGEMMDAIAGSMFQVRVPVRSLISKVGLKGELGRGGGGAGIGALRPPLAIVAADMLSRREVVFRRGLLWPALLASMAIPGVYPAQRIGEHVLVDGGGLNPGPCNVAAGVGAEHGNGVRPRPLAPARGRAR